MRDEKGEGDKQDQLCPRLRGGEEKERGEGRSKKGREGEIGKTRRSPVKFLIPSKMEKQEG